MLFRMTYDCTAYSSAPKTSDPIELKADINAIEALNEKKETIPGWPAGVVAVTDAEATPDNSVHENGRTSDGVKLFVSIEFLLEADGEAGVLAFEPDKVWLEALAEVLLHDFDFEESWDLLDWEPASPAPGPSQEDDPSP